PLTHPLISASLHSSIVFASLHSPFSSLFPPPPSSTLFPYTTLFRSMRHRPGLPRRSPRNRPGSSASRRTASSPLAERTPFDGKRSEEHTSELQSHLNLVCRLLLEKKKNKRETNSYTLQQYE